jgi:DNA (cytosine-5)-methyltransferase 1
MKLLDLFCGGGGAAMGYSQAGFIITGIDIDPNCKNYYPGNFICWDWEKAFTAQTLEGRFIDQFDIFHASPPCEFYSRETQYWINKEPEKYRAKYPEIIPHLRELLIATGKPYIIENVPQAPLKHPLVLCGLMFNLALYRHRHFETNFPVVQPDHPKHAGQQPFSVVGHPPSKPTKGIDYHQVIASWPGQMGIDWISPNSKHFRQAIPPAFTYYIATQYLEGVK